MTRRECCCQDRARIRRGRALRPAGSGGHRIRWRRSRRTLPAKAKSVIYLFMHGGVSHVDTFDPKPELTRRSGQPLSVELAKTIKTSFIHDPTKAILRGSPWQFRPGGKCGTPVSDLFPHVRERMDDIAVIRSCYGDVFDHAPAIYLRNTGSQFPGRPCLGSWVTYGLGTENQNLPAFVVMSDGSTKSGPPAYGAGFLPAVYQGTVFRGGENPILYLQNPPGVSGEAQRDTLRLHRPAGPPARAGAARRFDARSAHRLLRAGVSHAERRAGSGGFRQGVRRHQGALRARTIRSPTTSAASACWRAGWWSAACASSRFIREPTSATTGTTRTPI